MDLSDFLKNFSLDMERFQRNFQRNKISKHSGAKTLPKNHLKMKKIRRKMAKNSRRINRRKK